ncbi:RagB/SusD family nutrient uptake outer membrane protein [Flavivirga rizhaonensis]|uniref:RagB/SusD family nutrient uptake outer membrane protein n=1 Tax=Flavivirga rizhaonensis TaxID=2559571 RepID=A0A4S1DXI0_9FLAO|nr:RagB/SusD family nutrient uptake outer membrane protein [Flavivirga rizhaonensis]TGV02222.1 RagB/SusD family nutrient uptake outer membrane protein [Flavivirga rizhaonensis]
MKIKISIFALLTFILFCCSKDDKPVEIQTGNIKLEIVFNDGTSPILDATVSIDAISKQKVTGVDGLVTFENIEVGNYEVSVSIPFSDIITKENIVVEADKTTNELILIDYPKPITPEKIDIDKWLNACYESLVSDDIFGAKGYATYWGDVGVDVFMGNINLNFPTRKMDTYDFGSTDKIIEDIWTNHYQVIRKTTIGIEAIETSEYVTELNTDENIAKAEFKFLRALTYFNLVKLFGNPVLVTSTEIPSDNNSVVQDPLKVYEFIEADLIFAESNLSQSNIKNKASVSAAQALLGKVYLQMAGFPLLQSDKYLKALEQFNKLDGLYALETNYGDIFNSDKTANSSEVIFSIDFTIPNDSNLKSWDWFYWGPLEVTERDFFLLAPNFIKGYFKNPNDLDIPVSFPLNIEDSRFFENIVSFTIQNNASVNAEDTANWRPYKFSENYQEGKSFQLPYLRYADILLMIAEVENAINGGPTIKAYDAINKVRRRAFGNTENDVTPGLNQQDFLDVLFEERLLELCFEGHRKDDLIRIQKLESVIENHNANSSQNMKNYQSHKHILPIPELEINLNPGVFQNPGY